MRQGGSAHNDYSPSRFSDILSEIARHWQNKESKTKAGKMLARIKMRRVMHDAVLVARMTGARRMLTAAFRKNMPDFFIIGAAKCGTTTLWDVITSHPGVWGMPAVKEKEPWYFGTSPLQLRWYRCLFPIKRDGKMMGDASTSYLPSALAPVQIRCVLPDAKFIVILRNPVDRALSQYEFDKRRGLDTPPSFEKALETEHTPVAESGVQTVPGFFQYKAWGRYAEQLERWFAVFDRDRFLILTTSELQRDRQGTANRIFSFLGLPEHSIADVKDANAGRYSGMRPETRRMLAEYYQAHNERLYRLLGRRFDW